LTHPYGIFFEYAFFQTNMSLFSLLAALLLEHLHPLKNRMWVYQYFGRYADFLEQYFNAGKKQHGAIAWGLAVLPPVVLVGVVQWIFYSINPLLAWLWGATVLYATMGFKYYSETVSEIALALKRGELEQARSLFAKWRGQAVNVQEPGDVARLTIEHALLSSHRQMFAVIFWFILLGPAGAVLYRLASVMQHKWGEREDMEFGEFGRFAARFFELYDWLPVRLTALCFAVVGDFEDAVYCWRAQAQSWMNPTQGILLASGAGALGVKLGEALHLEGSLEFRPELGVGDEADPDYVESAVSLIWRTLVLWLAILLLLQLGRWVGG
jgi:adenosylcobinamide-phosphate synthase